MFAKTQTGYSQCRSSQGQTFRQDHAYQNSNNRRPIAAAGPCCGPKMTALTLPVLAAAFLLSMYFRSYFGVVGPALSADLSLSPEQFGRLASTFFASFSILQIPVGMSFDKWGVRGPMAAMMSIGAAGSAIVALSPGYWCAITGQSFVGIGCAPIFMGVLYYLGRTNEPERAGRLSATVSAVGSAGALLSASPLSWFVEVFGWQSACWLAAAAMAVSAAAVAFVLGPTPASIEESDRDQRPWSLVSLFYLVPVCFTLSLGGTFRNAWAVPYVTSVFGEHVAVGAMLTTISVVGIVTSFMLPIVLMRVPGRTIVISTYGAGVTCAIFLSSAPGFTFLSACAGLSVLYAMGNVHPLVMTEAQTLIPPRVRGLALGGLNTLVFLGVSVASAVYGEIAGLSLSVLSSYRVIFAVSAAVIAMAMFCYIVFRGRNPLVCTDREFADNRGTKRD
ncbi:MFS transporter [Rhizobium sp. BK379]|jgi:MFS family permease|uniref:MFS transporter n=1 Tax=Rhizobium sp. BK379 TaxID=2587059 RepID=UPI001612A08D|nr:MFS transporter [Rhizobium sp. BK379]MBB3447132.1 MFS family permease [Rhizobium sp. BK379]